MAPTNQQGIPSDQEPTLREIVVADQDFIRPDTAEVSLEGSTGDSSKQQCTQNNSDRPASRQSANARDEEPSTLSPTPHNAKPASPKKGQDLHCDDCRERKRQKTPPGRKRINAKWGCEDCRRLRDAAGQPRSRRPNRQRSSTARQARREPGNSQPALEKAEQSQPVTPEIVGLTWERQNPGKTPEADLWRKQWKVSGASKQQQQQSRGFNPGTDSDDPDNLPKPLAENPLVDRFGQRKDHLESIRQIQQNCLQGNAQPPVAADPKPDFYDENDVPVYLNNDGPAVSAASPASHQGGVLPSPMIASGNPIQTQSPAGLMGNPLQVADERDQPPPRFEDHLHAMPHRPYMAYAPSPVPVTASGPQQQQHGGIPIAYAPRPEFLGTPIRRNEFQGNTDFTSFFQYPDPTECEMSHMPSYFDDAMEATKLSNACEALHQSDWQSTGAPSSRNTVHMDANYPSNFGASSSWAQFDSTSTPGPANPEPADRYGYQRHPGLRPGPTNLMVARAPGVADAFQVPAQFRAPRRSGATNNSQNNGGPAGQEAGRAIFGQYIN